MPPPAPEPPWSSGVQVFVNAIRLTGNTVFSDQDLAPIVAPYLGAITTEELLDLRDALTARYVEAGYVNSGALIPDQEVRDGVIGIQIVEGRLMDVVVNGLTSLDPEFVVERIRLGAVPPLKRQPASRADPAVPLDPAIDQVNARLGPGPRRGAGRLEVDAVEALRYQPTFRFANDRSPAVGAEHGELTLSFGNLLGRSDPLRLHVGASEGLKDAAIDYSVPLTARDLRVFMSGETTDSEVVEEPFNAINVESTSSSLQGG